MAKIILDMQVHDLEGSQKDLTGLQLTSKISLFPSLDILTTFASYSPEVF